jgi:phytoene desaturase
MYLGIEGRYDDVSHHTIYLAENYKREPEATSKSATSPLRQPLLLRAERRRHRPHTLAPKGHSTLYVLLPVTHEPARRLGQGDAALPRPGARADEEDRHQRCRARIRTEKHPHPRRLGQRVRLYKGATFSMAHSLDQMLHLRPHNRFEDIGQMYLVGGGTHPGSGLPRHLRVARITSRLLLEDLKIEPQWEPTSSVADAIRRDDLVGVGS